MQQSKVITIIVAAATLLLILWFAGAFQSDTLAPGHVAKSGPARQPPQVTTVAHLQQMTEVIESVGTVRPRTETRIEAQVTGKVREVRVRAGDVVKRGEPLIILDDRELTSRRVQAEQSFQSAKAKREQARQAISEAQAGNSKAVAQFQRIQKLFKDKAVTSREMDQAEADYRQALSRLEQAREGLIGAESEARRAAEALEETRIALGYTVIRAPEDMQVARRSVEPGDLAIPGKALLVVQTAGAMRLEAFVREGLIRRVRPGVEMNIVIPALERTARGVVEEVLPSADPATRTFLVKVALPDIPGLHPGMFGRLLVPAGKRNAVLVDVNAIRRVGQLESVLLQDKGSWTWIYVKTGEHQGNEVEILAGLSGGETVGLPGADHAN
ncbi:efflux RND transporter periplasmic adaptor subunit [Desulfovibrio ferrophilus]|uniref:Efflux transporter, RND family, MFP subunit n=1 Tax=Desulfovibrio ferrophilus TaxID=241368 RepID=A0A2Z6B2Z5_9BACT|nr:efflux RND transporter periplasmic adaptor subunit [Desulfovibrio ferrophilus]BBD09861.1 efflux transporter, RND family, MFP subunit [Desulfovibrio ferrophilus]